MYDYQDFTQKVVEAESWDVTEYSNIRTIDSGVHTHTCRSLFLYIILKIHAGFIISLTI